MCKLYRIFEHLNAIKLCATEIARSESLRYPKLSTLVSRLRDKSSSRRLVKSGLKLGISSKWLADRLSISRWFRPLSRSSGSSSSSFEPRLRMLSCASGRNVPGEILVMWFACSDKTFKRSKPKKSCEASTVKLPADKSSRSSASSAPRMDPSSRTRTSGFPAALRTRSFGNGDRSKLFG